MESDGTGTIGITQAALKLGGLWALKTGEV